MPSVKPPIRMHDTTLPENVIKDVAKITAHHYTALALLEYGYYKAALDKLYTAKRMADTSHQKAKTHKEKYVYQTIWTHIENIIYGLTDVYIHNTIRPIV